MPVVSVVVVNWNGRDRLMACLESLFQQRSEGPGGMPDFEIILVDNGSEDGSVERVRGVYGCGAGSGSTGLSDVRLRIIENDRNLGFARGCNQGIEASRSPWIALINNDAVADPLWLAELLRKGQGVHDHGSRELARIGMVASRVLRYDDHDILDSMGVGLYPDGMSRAMFRGQRDKGLGASGQENLEDEDYAVIIPSGAACLLRRDMVDEVGLFSEDFFAYADDTDLALRAQLAGWCCVLARGAVAYHHYSSTAGAYSSMKIFYAERNRIWILIKFFPLSMIIKSWYYTLVRYLAVIYYLFRDRKSRDRRARPGFSITGSLTAVIKAYFSAAKGISRQCAERKKLCTSARARGRLFSEWLKPGTSSGKFRLDLKSLSSMD